MYVRNSLFKLREKNKKYILCVVYRPPKLSEDNDRILYDEIKSVNKDKNAVICGDFNNPSVNWSTITADREGTRLLQLIEESFLYQIVMTPTRGNNILDLIFTNDSDIIHTCEVGESLCNSDHNIVRTELNLQIITKENMLLIPNYRKANFANIRREIESVNWNQCLENVCIDETYNTLTANLKSIVNENIPHKSRRINVCQPVWMTDRLQKILAKKRKAYKKTNYHS